MCDSYKHLKDKLEAALISFKKTGTIIQSSYIKEEKDSVNRIAIILNKINNSRLFDDIRLQEILQEKIQYENRIRLYMDKIHRTIFDDLMKYKSLTEREQVEDILDGYGIKRECVVKKDCIIEKDYIFNGKIEEDKTNADAGNQKINTLKICSKEHLKKDETVFENGFNGKESNNTIIYKEYVNNFQIIKKLINLFRKSIECDEVLLKKLENIDNNSEESLNGSSKLDLKLKGLDPRLYKFYSSSDDITPISKDTSIQKSLDNTLNNLLDAKKVDEEKKLDYQSNINDKNIKNAISGVNKNNSIQSNLENGIIENIMPVIKDFTEEELKAKIENILEKKDNEELNVVESKINAAKEDLRRTEELHRFDLQTEHGLKEKIHLIFKKMNLNKLEMAERVLEKLEGKLNDELTEKQKITGFCNEKSEKLYLENRIKSNLLKIYKEINWRHDAPEEMFLKQRIDSFILKISKSILEDKGKVNDYILSSIEEVICQGTLEDDNRFLEKLERQLKDIEEKSEPRYFKISVNMEIAKKYVKDIISLKKKNLLTTYYNQ